MLFLVFAVCISLRDAVVAALRVNPMMSVSRVGWDDGCRYKPCSGSFDSMTVSGRKQGLLFYTRRDERASAAVLVCGA